ncbi:MAG: formylglycine-generating enzyme family protein [Prolixibacteraceae bacterium]
MKKSVLYVLIAVLFSCTGNKNQQEKAANLPNETPSSEQPKPEKFPAEKQKNNEPVAVPAAEMVYFEGGTFMMGSENGLPNERPVHQVQVEPFHIDKTPVTVAQFRQFVNATGFKTEAEKFGDSGVFNFEQKTWELLPGATWRKPFGPAGPDAEDNHPVTHVSWNDAVAYANWAGKRLPTEKEWEYAARSGENSEKKFSWGNSVSKDGQYFANTWQGDISSTEAPDGYLFTSPVGVFGGNDAGVTDMGGNVWQWCAGNYTLYPGNPQSYREDPNVKVIRSGSFFYDENGEDSFSVSGRSMNSHETSLFNTGFRCAKDAE